MLGSCLMSLFMFNQTYKDEVCLCFGAAFFILKYEKIYRIIIDNNHKHIMEIQPYYGNNNMTPPQPQPFNTQIPTNTTFTTNPKYIIQQQQLHIIISTTRCLYSTQQQHPAQRVYNTQPKQQFNPQY